MSIFYPYYQKLTLLTTVPSVIYSTEVHYGPCNIHELNTAEGKDRRVNYNLPYTGFHRPSYNGSSQ